MTERITRGSFGAFGINHIAAAASVPSAPSSTNIADTHGIVGILPRRLTPPVSRKYQPTMPAMARPAATGNKSSMPDSMPAAINIRMPARMAFQLPNSAIIKASAPTA